MNEKSAEEQTNMVMQNAGDAPKEDRALIQNWVHTQVITYGVLENVAAGHLKIVGWDPNTASPMFKLM